MLQAADNLGCHLLGPLACAGRSFPQPWKDILNPIGLEDIDRETGPDELGCPHMRKQREKRFPKAVDICDQYRLGVAAELLPGKLLNQFLERSDAARQRHE